jgi:PAS domain S-box-containing protein
MNSGEKRMMSINDLEATYESIINNPLMAIVISVDNKAVFVNDRTLEITGFSKGEFIKLYNRGLDAIHPEDHKVLLHAKTEANADNSIQIRILHKSKEFIWIESFMRTINFHGQQGFMLSFIDISKRIQYDKDLFRLNEAAKDLISQTSEEGIYEYILSLLHKTHKNIIIACNIKNINENKVKVKSITGLNNDFKVQAWNIMGF